MSLETATYVYNLVPTNPDGPVDLASTADDHIRLIKACLQRTFPNMDGAVTVTPAAINTAVTYGVLRNTSSTISATLVFAKLPNIINPGAANETTLQAVYSFRGLWSGAGTTVTGVRSSPGWTMSRPSHGTARLLSPFNLTTPVAVASIEYEGTGRVFIHVNHLSSTQIDLWMFDASGSATDAAFNALVVDG